jgi:hypothetical protein
MLIVPGIVLAVRVLLIGVGTMNVLPIRHGTMRVLVTRRGGVGVLRRPSAVRVLLIGVGAVGMALTSRDAVPMLTPRPGALNVFSTAFCGGALLRSKYRPERPVLRTRTVLTMPNRRANIVFGPNLRPPLVGRHRHTTEAHQEKADKTSMYH